MAKRENYPGDDTRLFVGGEFSDLADNPDLKVTEKEMWDVLNQFDRYYPAAVQGLANTPPEQPDAGTNHPHDPHE